MNVCWDTLEAILGSMGPGGRGLDKLAMDH